MYMTCIDLLFTESMFINYDFAAASSSTIRGITLMIMLPVVIIFTMVLVCYMWYVRRYKEHNRKGNGKAYPDDLCCISVPM